MRSGSNLKDLKACTASIRECGKQIQWQSALGQLQLLSGRELRSDCIVYSGAMVACRAVAWRSSLELWISLRSKCIEADIITCGSVVTTYEIGQKWSEAHHFLRHLRKLGIQTNVFSFNAALKAFNPTEWQHAEFILQELGAQQMKPDIISVNTAVSMLDLPQWKRATLHLGSCRADVVTYSSVATKVGWQMATLLLTDLRNQQIRADTALYNSLCGRWQQAQQICALAGDWRPNVITYNTMISACADADQWRKAGHVLQDLQQTFQRTQLISTNSMINGLAKSGEWQQAASVLWRLQLQQLEHDFVTFSGVISACEKGGQWEHALLLLHELQRMKAPVDTIVYSAAISAIEKCGIWWWAVALLEELLELQLQADSTLCNAAISACKKQAEWQQAQGLFQKLHSLQLQANIVSFSSLISTLEKAGRWQEAITVLQQLLNQNVEANVVSFNAAISACEKRGEWRMARNLMNVLMNEAIEPDEITFNAILSSCDKGTQWSSAVLLRAEVEQMWSELSRSPLSPLISFNATISACQKATQWHQALAVLIDLQSQRVESDVINVGLAADVHAKSRESESLTTALHYIQQSCESELAMLTNQQKKRKRLAFSPIKAPVLPSFVLLEPKCP